MRVDQAIFTSAPTRQQRGYHLLCRSPGIDEQIAQDLTRWSPTHGSLADDAVDAQSINYFPVGGGRVAIARTVYGGPEYSDRGALQVVTLILVMYAEQLEGYDFNPLNVLNTARALGQLRLRSDISASAAQINLPDRRLSACESSRVEPATNKEAVSRSLRLLQDGYRVGFAGVEDPLTFLESLLHHVPVGERLQLSFSTGLKPSHHRPFCLQFASAETVELKSLWNQQGIRFIDPK